MLDLSRLRELNLSEIDIRSITPEEWEAVQREAVRRAHAERAKLVRDLIKQLRCWWQDRKQRREPVVGAGKTSWS
jgi:hypothetical protein